MDARALIGKLSDTARQGVEMAASVAVGHRHYSVELEHLVIGLLRTETNSLAVLLAPYQLNATLMIEAMEHSIAHFDQGNHHAPSFSSQVIDIFKKAWMLSSLEYGLPAISSAACLVVLFREESLRLLIISRCRFLDRVDLDRIVREGHWLARQEFEQGSSVDQAELSVDNHSSQMPEMPKKVSALERYTLDLTERARAGDIDPVIGRESEVRQVIDILCRRRQNNPLLAGEAGVGKTAIVEGLALRIVAGQVPDSLKQVAIRVLDLTLLQAGAGVRGEFEQRLKSVVDEVKQSSVPVILFIDEAHTLVGAGGSNGQGDAANILKPALARGELRTLAATTWAEYKRFFEKDAALTRRFQVVKVEEPSIEVACAMLRAVASRFETHHGVIVLAEAIEAAVTLSKRYISGRQLPDVGISLLDTACSRVSMQYQRHPSILEDLQGEMEALRVQVQRLEREQALYGTEQQALAGLNERLASFEIRETEILQRWHDERTRVDRMISIRNALLGEELEKASLLEELSLLQNELNEIQGEAPLIRPHVDKHVISEVVSAWTGIPAGKMLSDELMRVMSLRQELGKRIVGQDHALDRVSESIRVSRAGLADPNQPLAVFMFCGTSGVGKTETALALADLMYGGEQNLTVINLSEYKEEHKVSLLMGAPPGYVGYGEGGVLTEAVRRKPYSVILLDEIEKAHPGIQDIFYQVFDKGMLKDGEGRDIDFRNTLIIMTSNAGTETLTAWHHDSEADQDFDKIDGLIKPELLHYFKPAFLGRLSIIPYLPLQDEALQGIVALQLDRVVQRMRMEHGIELLYGVEVVKAIVSRCQEVDTGARNAIHIIKKQLLPRLSLTLLNHLSSGVELISLEITVDDQGQLGVAVNGGGE
ncbi:type VI secretion system ATPase TssH [Nitrincola alkalisediminis]|uniref:type VI secretion system ATPase TssH n=1 Tax=Nitrincola alkalisediminis TaxID=1366656 RepID=UPI0018742C06|nr:type VI secretion system ATPase TssH [Nitrincola alkalisediminis]